jgi:surface protein
MSCTFSDAKSFNQPIEQWNVSSVTDMGAMLSGTVCFNQPLNKWDVSNVERMTHLFWGASSFNQPLHHWNVANVTDMCGLFGNACNFNQPVLEQWNTKAVQQANKMFEGAGCYSHLDWQYFWNFNKVRNEEEDSEDNSFTITEEIASKGKKRKSIEDASYPPSLRNHSSAA